jgi:uncharacterized membrane protein
MAEPTKSASDDKVMAAVATIPLVGLILFYAMKDASPMVKNYAKQSNYLLALNVVVFVLSMILAFIPVLGCISPILYLVPLAAWILLLVKALQEVPDYKLPVLGEWFDKLLK